MISRLYYLQEQNEGEKIWLFKHAVSTTYNELINFQERL